jgi:hypothetical protein
LAATIYTDNVRVGPGVWYAPNRYYITGISTDPGTVIINGTFCGDPETASDSVDTQNEWFWTTAGGDSLFIISTDTTLVEYGARDKCINIITKDYITIDGLDLKNSTSWGVYVGNGSSYINVNNTTSHGNGKIGVKFEESTNCGMNTTTAYDNRLSGLQFIVNSTPGTLTNCTSYNNLEEGFTVEDSSDAVTYTNCIAYNNGKSGFSTSDVSGIIYNYCLSYNNGQVLPQSGNGFGVWDDNSIGSGCTYNYCIAYGNANSGIQINHALPAPNHTKINNGVFYNNAGYNIWVKDDSVGIKNSILMDAGWNKEFLSDSSISPVFSNNLYYDSDGSTSLEFDQSTYTTKATWEAASGESGSVWSDPLFTDAANDDFTLQFNSPCIDEAFDWGQTQDYSGNDKSGLAWDIGAFESGYVLEGKGFKRFKMFKIFKIGK